MTITVKKITGQLLNGLDSRQKDILESRYGLVNVETQTLQAIGDRYGITREGIRRIEEQALERVAKNVNNSELAVFVKAVKDYLHKLGGVRREADLVTDVRCLINEHLSPDLFANHLKFLLEISNFFSYHPETKDFYNYWYLSDEDRKSAAAFVAALVKALKRGEASEGYLKQTHFANYAAISKKFAVNVYGKFGLSELPEIVPKSARDWAYLIMKNKKKPIHFLELADQVNGHQEQKFHPQTVHNELIKDDKFVLVGKGTYALREHGYVPGIAREVIARLLHQHGPLPRQDVVRLVLQERFFKENTVLINLQNRTYFKRLPDGRYTTLA